MTLPARSHSRAHRKLPLHTVTAALLAALALAVPASAAPNGGAQAPEGGDSPARGVPGGGDSPPRARSHRRPALTAVVCVARCAGGGRVRTGSTIELRGRRLGAVTRVIFRGRRGKADDVAVRVRPRSTRVIRLRVPPAALSGPLSARVSRRVRSSPVSIAILPSQLGFETRLAPVDGHVFPVQGPYRYPGAGGRFGAARGGRSHRGQDISAACGVPLVAARGGVVKARQYHALAGHYLVIASAETGFDYVYMHMSAASVLGPGASVATGQRIGTVGATGNSRGCHLHFEMWTAPGWYSGGSPIDPLPSLRAWGRGG